VEHYFFQPLLGFFVVYEQFWKRYDPILSDNDFCVEARRLLSIYDSKSD
jgi:hypothetical protein